MAEPTAEERAAFKELLGAFDQAKPQPFTPEEMAEFAKMMRGHAHTLRREGLRYVVRNGAGVEVKA